MAGLGHVVQEGGTGACPQPALEQRLGVAVDVMISHIPQVAQEEGAGKKKMHEVRQRERIGGERRTRRTLTAYEHREKAGEGGNKKQGGGERGEDSICPPKTTPLSPCLTSRPGCI